MAKCFFTEEKLEIYSNYLFILLLICSFLLIAFFDHIMFNAKERNTIENWIHVINFGFWSFVFSIKIYKTYLENQKINGQMKKNINKG